MPKITISKITAKPLPFNPKKLKGISEKLIKSHWENNYMASVKVLNTLYKKIADARSDKDFAAFEYNGLMREHLYRTGSIVFHNLYFENLGGNGKASGEIEKIIKSNFGEFKSWETEFKKIGESLGGGPGWVVLGYNYHLKLLENYWVADHMHGPVGVAPLLVMDMYEHSYQMDYGAAADEYIDAFFKNIQWEEVENRYKNTKTWKLI